MKIFSLLRTLALSLSVSCSNLQAADLFDGLEGESTGTGSGTAGYPGQALLSGIRDTANAAGQGIRDFFASEREAYSSMATAADLRAREGFKLIRMPDMHAQQEYNTCGTHSMARYLKHIGFQVNWDAFYEEATKRSFFRPFATTGVAGTLPNAAVSFLRRRNQNFRMIEDATPQQISNSINNGRPLMVLLRVGDQGAGVPSMHWVTIVGYDLRRRLWFLYDTNGNNIYKSTWDQFRAAHRFSRNSGLMNGVFSYLADVQPGTAIYCGPSSVTAKGTCRGSRLVTSR